MEEIYILRLNFLQAFILTNITFHSKSILLIKKIQIKEDK
jgi:hypothetical protein